MNILIAEDALVKLLFASASEKKALGEIIIAELKKGNRFYITSLCYNNILNRIDDFDLKMKVIVDLKIFTENIIPLTYKDIELALRLENELLIENLTELSIAINFSIDKLLTTSKKLSEQKLIKVVVIE